MTRDVTSCPECGGETRHEWTKYHWSEEVRICRTCTECPTQYLVSYATPVIEEVEQIE